MLEPQIAFLVVISGVVLALLYFVGAICRQWTGIPDPFRVGEFIPLGYQAPTKAFLALGWLLGVIFVITSLLSTISWSVRLAWIGFWIMLGKKPSLH